VKDIVDISIIAKNFKCDFKEIISEAKEKEAGIDPVAIYEILTTFPPDKLDLIKWINKPDQKQFKNELLIIAEDILYGRQNSLSH
jgi:hypothetical protein